MQKDNDQLQSLLDSDDQNTYRKARQIPLLYQPRNKTIDLYQSLISTNHQGIFYSQLLGNDEFEQEMSEIDFLSYQQQPKRKRGRPKKNQKKEEQEYRSGEQEQQEIQIRLNKNKKKRANKLAKGNTKNIFNFFQRLIINYLKKSTQIEQLKQFEQLKKGTNRFYFFELITNKNFHPALSQMFESRYLNREVVCSKLSLETKLLYLKKIQIFKEIFDRKETRFNQ